MYFLLPVMVLFWQNNGLSLTQVMFLQSFFAILVVVLEVPTGYFADIYGRKKSLIIASIFAFLGMLMYTISKNFYHFLIVEIFFAINISFSSGAFSAFMYDTLIDLGREKEYKKIWGNLLFYGLIFLAVSNLIGGYIGSFNMRLDLYLSLPFFAAMIPVALSLNEPKKHKEIFKNNYFKELVSIVKNIVTNNKKLLWIIIYSGVIYAFNQSALWLYQPYFKISGLDIVYFGVVFAAFQFVAAISSKYAHAIEKKIGQKYSLIMLVFLVAGSYFLMSNFVFLFSFSFAFIQQFVRSFRDVVVTDYIHILTESKIRATILSLESLVGKLLYAFIIPIFGWVADVYTLVQALSVIGISTIIIGCAILIILKKNNII
jgi:MFS family permease